MDREIEEAWWWGGGGSVFKCSKDVEAHLAHLIAEVDHIAETSRALYASKLLVLDMLLCLMHALDSDGRRSPPTSVKMLLPRPSGTFRTLTSPHLTSELPSLHASL